MDFKFACLPGYIATVTEGKMKCDESGMLLDPPECQGRLKRYNALSENEQNELP